MEGADSSRTPPHKIIETGIAHVPESRRLFPRLTVEDNLRMGAFIPAARAKFAERLDYVYTLFPRLKERRTQLAGTMSGGEQQMCAIARALMSGPKLVLLDEPSMGLAPVIVAQVFDLVRRIRAEGYTVLIVEQNVRQVLKVVDRAYLLEVGRIEGLRLAPPSCRQRRHPQGVHGDLTMRSHRASPSPRGPSPARRDQGMGGMPTSRVLGPPHPTLSPRGGGNPQRRGN